MDKPESAASAFGPIHDRIGPIADPAFLQMLNEGQIKSIVLTVARAEYTAVLAQAKALEDVVKIVEGVEVQSEGT
ncbi:MAG: hypothetical protein ABSE93_07455 [Terriglobia bacterium]|jgi:hypothetical protein